MTKRIKEVQFGNRTLRLETGEIARQASAAVLASMGGTQVLVAVVASKNATVGQDFFPFTVQYQIKSYAAGRIPSGFKKRESRPSDNETLVARLIDRPLRPLFPAGFNNEVQVTATVLSLDPEVSADIVAMIGASAALSVSGIPFDGPISAARVGYADGIYLLNQSNTTDSELNLVVAGTKDGILMVESQACELSEDIMLGAVLYGHEMMQNVIKAILELKEEVGNADWELNNNQDTSLYELVAEKCSMEITKAYQIRDKACRYEKLSAISDALYADLLAQNPELSVHDFNNAIEKLKYNIVRKNILDGEPRIDGRDLKTVRPISIRTKLLERVHGSVLFTRGETQAIVTATLGNKKDAQILDALDGEDKEVFMLHYNFPPYSVGETGMVGSPKRREIGHGALARRSMMAVLPDMKNFPYVIRVVSEITESNGSSSMASVCGATLALMDAGVPIKMPVAGIAMGLIKEGEKFAVLTDILGDEDHLGDMDFKVAGTKNGITALQMDIKIQGITKEIMEIALSQAREGRLHILEVMHNALDKPRDTLSEHAPRIVSMQIAEDKIRTLIGKGGATIKQLTESTGVSIDIDDTGLVQLFSANASSLEDAQKQIKSLLAEVEVGQIYEGKVSKIMDFGAFINLLPGKDGLLHISQICKDRNQKVDTVLQEGQIIKVLVAGIDKQGKIKLEWQDKPVQDNKEDVPQQTDGE